MVPCWSSVNKLCKCFLPPSAPYHSYLTSPLCWTSQTSAEGRAPSGNSLRESSGRRSLKVFVSGLSRCWTAGLRRIPRFTPLFLRVWQATLHCLLRCVLLRRGLFAFLSAAWSSLWIMFYFWSAVVWLGCVSLHSHGVLLQRADSDAYTSEESALGLALWHSE